jgi:hypothetical protein
VITLFLPFPSRLLISHTPSSPEIEPFFTLSTNAAGFSHSFTLSFLCLLPCSL